MPKGIRPLSCEVLVCVFSNMCMVINAEINGIIQLLRFHLKFTIAVSWLSAEHFTDHRFAALAHNQLLALLSCPSTFTYRQT